MSKVIKVIAERVSSERVLLEEELTEGTLALLQKQSPLSRAFLDGAGLPYRPKSVAVFVDDQLLWRVRCPRRGSTDDAIGKPTECYPEVMTFTDAYGEGYTDERAASNRAAWQDMRNEHEDWAEEVASDLVELAGSLRPIRRPVAPKQVAPKSHAPYPSPRYGDTDVTLGLPYTPSGSWRRVRCLNSGPGVAFHDVRGTWLRQDIEFLPALPVVPDKPARKSRPVLMRRSRLTGAVHRVYPEANPRTDGRRVSGRRLTVRHGVLFG